MEYEVLQKVGQGAYGVVWKDDKSHGNSTTDTYGNEVYEGDREWDKQHGCREVSKRIFN